MRYSSQVKPISYLKTNAQDRLRLRSLLLAGAASAPTAPVDTAYFNGLRDRVRKAIKSGFQG